MLQLQREVATGREMFWTDVRVAVLNGVTALLVALCVIGMYINLSCQTRVAIVVYVQRATESLFQAMGSL